MLANLERMNRRNSATTTKSTNPITDARKTAKARVALEQSKTKQTLRDLLARGGDLISSPKQTTSNPPSPPKTVSPLQKSMSSAQTIQSSNTVPRTIGTMSSELAVLRREEEACEARLLSLEAEALKVQAAIDGHSARYADLRDEIARVSASYAEAEDSLSEQLDALQEERAEAEEKIAFESETEAKKAMENWTERLQSVTEDVERECKLEIEDSVNAEKQMVAEMNRYAAEARLKAAEVSSELTRLVSHQLEGSIASYVASIDNQRAASLRAVQQHMFAIHRLEALLSAVKEGRDTGEDVSIYLKDSFGHGNSSSSSPSSSPTIGKRGGNSPSLDVKGGESSLNTSSSSEIIQAGENVLSQLEINDAMTLQLQVPRARQELGDLVDKIITRWGKLRISSSSSSSSSSLSSLSSSSISPSKKNSTSRFGVSTPFEFLSTSIDVFADGSVPDQGSNVGVDVADLIRALIEKFKPTVNESKVSLLQAQKNEAIERIAKLDQLGPTIRNAERIQLLRVISAADAGIREAIESNGSVAQ